MFHRCAWVSCLVALGSCSLSVSFDGSSYTCDDGVCPSGWVCGADDMCRIAAPALPDAGTPPEACFDENAAMLDDGGCLVLHLTPRTYQEAADYCVFEYGGFMAVLTGEDERAAIARLPRFQGINEVWIGLDDREREGRFHWLSGDRLQAGLDNWNVNEPNNGKWEDQDLGEEDCVAARMDLGGVWDDRGCDIEYSYVCEQEPAGQ